MISSCHKSFIIVSCLCLLSSCTPEESISKPVLGLTRMSIITEATASCISLITSEGGGAITERGICWNTTPYPSIENNKTSDALGMGEFTSTITNLSPNTTYYARAYATNKGGTAYGLQATFTTKSLDLITVDATSISAQSAISGGNVSSNGDSLTVTERGICWSTTVNPTVNLETKTVTNSKVGSFICTITNLLPNTTYYARVYATNCVGTTYGNEINFTTKNGVVNMTATAATFITTTSSILGGNITDDGGASVIERGICWSTNFNPTISLTTKVANGLGLGSFSCDLTGLMPNTKYYVRAYATNSVGTSYSNEIIFITNQLLTDVDGNVYNTVTIGTQTWMMENLKTTKYRDGTSIPNVTDNDQWILYGNGAYCDYNNIVSNSAAYGRLYNWYAVFDSRNIAPVGWHVPTNAEWETLITYLGGESVAGGKLKESGTKNWQSPNTAATNEVGFSAIPCGHRTDYNGAFYMIGNTVTWWSTSHSWDQAYTWSLYFNKSNIVGDKNYYKYAYSVRCLKD